MQALLLAAGRSKRFWPLPDKNFLKLGGKTLIEYQVAALRQAGLKKLVIVGGAHNLTKLKKLFPRETIVEQHELDQGMAGAILAAEQHLNQPTLVLSTNDLFDPAAIKKVLTTKTTGGAILAQLVNEYFPGGYLQLGAKKRVIGIVEKPGAGNEPSNVINIVCHLYQEPARLVAAIQTVLKKQGGWFAKKKVMDDVYEQALNQLVQEEEFLAVEYRGAWQALKYPWHVLAASQHFLKTIKKYHAKTVEIAKTAVIKGAVIIEDGVKIFDHAVIIGPVYIGKGAVVGTGSLIRESIIGAGAVVGSQTEVARSYIGEQTWLHRNYVGDSVLGNNVSLGSGAVTGNLRLDEEDISVRVNDQLISTGGNKFGTVIGEGCRVGINVSLMPGVLIGENSFIGSGLLISQSIPKNTFATGMTELQLKTNKKVASPRNLLK